MRRKIDAALSAKIVLEAAREQATVVDLAEGDGVHLNPICAWKKQLPKQAARVFDAGVGRESEEARARKIQKLHAKIGQLTVERVHSYAGLGRAPRRRTSSVEEDSTQRVVDDLEVGERFGWVTGRIGAFVTKTFSGAVERSCGP